MTYENFIMAALAKFALDEGYRFGGTDCTLAVAQIIANRVEAGWFGGDWIKVIEDAPNVRGTIHTEPFKYSTRETPFRQAIAQIDDVYHGTADDTNVNHTTSEGITRALYYCQLHNVNSDWFKKNVLGDLEHHPRMATVGQLTFFG